MISIPPQVVAAMKAGTEPVAFAQMTMREKTCRYCGADQDVEWGGHLWSSTPSLTVVHAKDEIRPDFLTPIPAVPRHQSNHQFAATANLRQHWRLVLSDPTDAWRDWLGQIGQTECDITVQYNVHQDHDEWFTLRTLRGKAVKASERHRQPKSDDAHRIVIECVDFLSYEPWRREGYSAAKIVELIERTAALGILVCPDGDHHSLIVKSKGREWVVGKSTDREKMHGLARAVMRKVTKGDKTSLRCIYKYMKREHAEQLINGYAFVSPDIRFGDASGGLSKGQVDEERSKTTTLPGISELLGSNDDIHGTSHYDEERGELTMNSDPYWMWCASMALTPSLLPEFNADVIVEITDLDDFSARLLRAGRAALRSTSDWCGVVDYEDHKNSTYYGLTRASIAHPSMMKNSDFEHQQEVRFVWIEGCRAEREAFPVDMGCNRHCARVIELPRAMSVTG